MTLWCGVGEGIADEAAAPSCRDYELRQYATDDYKEIRKLYKEDLME